MSNKTYVVGVGMTKFDKPGTKEGDYPEWAKEAGQNALADAGVPYGQAIEIAGQAMVDDVEVALQHNIGLGGAAAVSIYRRAA